MRLLHRGIASFGALLALVLVLAVAASADGDPAGNILIESGRTAVFCANLFMNLLIPHYTSPD